MKRVKIKTTSNKSLFFLSMILFLIFIIMAMIILLNSSFSLFPGPVEKPATYEFPDGGEAKYDPSYFTPEEAKEAAESFDHVQSE